MNTIEIEKRQILIMILGVIIFLWMFSAKTVAVQGRLIRMSTFDAGTTVTFLIDGREESFSGGNLEHLHLGGEYVLFFSGLAGFRLAGVPYSFVEVKP